MLAKAICLSLTGWDCLGVFIVLAYFQSEKILDYFFPKRPDVFAELSYIQEHVANLETKASELERDVTAIKFNGSARAR